MVKFIEIRAIRKGNGKYLYNGLTADGKLVTLRKSATRLYENAFYYEFPVCSGSNGIAAHFTYGKKPGEQWHQGVKIYPAEVFRVVA